MYLIRMTVAAALSALTLAACSSGGSNQDSNPPTGSGPASGPASVTTTTGSNAKATCNQIPPAIPKALMSEAYSGVKVEASGYQNDGQQCTFSAGGGEQAVDVIITPANDPVFTWQNVKGDVDGPVALPGVGVEAVVPAADFDVAARSASLVCSVSIGSETQFPGVDKYFSGGSPHFPPSAYLTINTALGAVCNAVFGSGYTTPDLSPLSTIAPAG